MPSRPMAAVPRSATLRVRQPRYDTGGAHSGNSVMGPSVPDAPRDEDALGLDQSPNLAVSDHWHKQSNHDKHLQGVVPGLPSPYRWVAECILRPTRAVSGIEGRFGESCRHTQSIVGP